MELKRIIFEVFYRVWMGRRVFAKALVIPFAISVGLDLLDLVGLPKILDIGDEVLSVAVYGWFAVTVHRLVLLGPESVPEWGLRRISKREVVFVLSFAFITVVALLPVILFTSLPVDSFAIGLLTLLIYVYLFSRLSLVLPAIAIDRWLTPLDSWRLSRPHQARLVFVLILFPIMLFMPFLLVIILIVSISPMLLGSVVPLYVAEVFESLATTFLLVFTVSALSIVYREITRLTTF